MPVLLIRDRIQVGDEMQDLHCVALFSALGLLLSLLMVSVFGGDSLTIIAS